MRKPALADFLLLLLFLLTAVPSARGQAGPKEREKALAALEGRTVVSVDVTGPRRVPLDKVRANLRTREGRPYSRAQVDQDIKRLWNLLKLMASAEVKVLGKGVAVRFQVWDFGAYQHFRVKGLHAITLKEALEIMDLREGAALDEPSARTKAELLLARYERMGYAFARVETRPSRDGRTLVFQVEEGPLVRVRSVKVVGNKAFPAFATLGLKKNIIGSAGVKSAPSHIINPELTWKDPEAWVMAPWVLVGKFLDLLFHDEPYSASTLKDDVERIRDFYRGEGYKDAEAAVQDVKFSPDKTRVDLTILVHEGPLYRVSKVDLIQELPPGRNKPLLEKKKILPLLKLVPGAPYRKETLERDEQTIKMYYGKRGFPPMDGHDDLKPEEAFQVLQPLEVFHPDRHEVDVSYRVQEGFRKRIRKINITGNRNTKDEVIRREISLHPGEPLDMVELNRSLYRLDALHYFEDSRGVTTVRKSLKSVPGSPDEVDLDVHVKEGKTGSLLWSAGVSTNLGFFGRFTLRRRNFDLLRPPTSANPVEAVSQILDGRAFYGGGQTLILDLQPGTRLNFFDIRFKEPDVFGLYEDRIGLDVSLYKRWRYYRNYRDERQGAYVGLSRLLNYKTRVSFGIRSEWVDVGDVDFDAPYTVWESEGFTRFRELTAGVQFKDVDDVLQPARGGSWDFEARSGGGPMGGTQDYLGASTEARLYLPALTDGKGRYHVLALRGGMDWNRPYGDTRVLHVSRRFFLGGRGTVRGFRYRGAGPSQFGNALGGEARWLASAEYLIPLFSVMPERGDRQIDMVRLVLFSDAGGLAREITDSELWDARVGMGVGVRVRIPGLSFLPIALDLGYPVVKQRSDHTQVFSIMLGLY